MTGEPHPAADQPRKKPLKKSGTYQAITFVLLISGILGILVGLLSLVSMLIEGFTLTSMSDTFINLAVGSLTVYCWRLMKTGKSRVILVFFATIVISLIHSFVMGRGFNFFAAGFGAIILLQLVVFLRSRELTS